MSRRSVFKTEKSPATPLRRRRSGFSLLELLAGTFIVAILVAIVLAAVSSARKSAHATQCLNQLRQIGQSFHSYCFDHSGRFPDPLTVQSTWEALVRPYLPSLAVLRCPADSEVFPALGSSYDWRDGGNTAASVAGKAIQACRPDAVLAFDALPGWHRQRMMNVVRIDGATMSLAEQDCFRDLRRNAGPEPAGN